MFFLKYLLLNMAILGIHVSPTPGGFQPAKMHIPSSRGPPMKRSRIEVEHPRILARFPDDSQKR